MKSKVVQTFWNHNIFSFPPLERTALQRPSKPHMFKKHYEALKFRRRFKVKGDGHCLIHSMIECMLEYKENHYVYDVQEVISGLRHEIEKNYSTYCRFLPSDVDIHSQLQLYEKHKYYNLEICDVFLLALCNFFNVEVVLVELSESGTNEIKYIVQPNCDNEKSFPKRVFYLLRIEDHYDPLLNYGEFIYRFKLLCKARFSYDCNKIVNSC